MWTASLSEISLRSSERIKEITSRQRYMDQTVRSIYTPVAGFAGRGTDYRLTAEKMAASLHVKIFLDPKISVLKERITPSKSCSRLGGKDGTGRTSSPISWGGIRRVQQVAPFPRAGGDSGGFRRRETRTDGPTDRKHPWVLFVLPS